MLFIWPYNALLVDMDWGGAHESVLFVLGSGVVTGSGLSSGSRNWTFILARLFVVPFD